MQTIIFSECPPSVNSLYPGRGRRFLSKRYKEWIIRTLAEIRNQRPKKIEAGKYGLILEIARRRKASDLNNFIKGCEDIMVKAGITPDDQNNVFTVTMPMTGNGVRVTLLDAFECDTLRGLLWNELPK